MKVTVIVSLVALALGYLLGKGNSAPEAETSKSKVKHVSRESRASGTRSRKRGEPKVVGRGLEYFLEEKRSPFYQSRLHACILQLSANEIQNALDLLIEKEKEAWGDSFDPDSGDRLEVSEEIILLLARWYELEGLVSLTWLKHQNFLLVDDCVDLEVDLVTDGFERAPGMGFQLCLNLVKRFGKEKLHIGHYAQMLYEIGRWGETPIGQLEQLDARQIIRSGFGLRPTSGKIFLGPSSRLETNAYIQGLIDSGRAELAYHAKAHFGESGRVAIEEVLGRAAGESSWQELKARIDSGALPFHIDRRQQVVSNLAREDLGKATDWFLAQDLGEESAREERIASFIGESDVFVVPGEISNDPFNTDDDPFGGARIDQKRAIKWLNDLEGRGEPVQEAWVSLVENAVTYHDLASVSNLKDRISPERWQRFEEEILAGAIHSETQRVLGKELTFQSLNTHWGSGKSKVEELGLLEQAEEQVAAQNALARDQLRAILAETE